MAKYGIDDGTMRAKILEQVEKMLRDPSVEVAIERGVRHIHDWSQPWVETEPTDGVTLTIKVNGGAVDVKEYRGPGAAAFITDGSD